MATWFALRARAAAERRAERRTARREHPDAPQRHGWRDPGRTQERVAMRDLRDRRDEQQREGWGGWKW